VLEPEPVKVLFQGKDWLLTFIGLYLYVSQCHRKLQKLGFGFGNIIFNWQTSTISNSLVNLLKAVSLKKITRFLSLSMKSIFFYIINYI